MLCSFYFFLNSNTADDGKFTMKQKYSVIRMPQCGEHVNYAWFPFMHMRFRGEREPRIEFFTRILTHKTINSNDYFIVCIFFQALWYLVSMHTIPRYKPKAFCKQGMKYFFFSCYLVPTLKISTFSLYYAPISPWQIG